GRRRSLSQDFKLAVVLGVLVTLAGVIATRISHADQPTTFSYSASASQMHGGTLANKGLAGTVRWATEPAAGVDPVYITVTAAQMAKTGQVCADVAIIKANT